MNLSCEKNLRVFQTGGMREMGGSPLDVGEM